MTFSERLAGAAGRLLQRRVSRRRALSRVAVAGAALAVAPVRYLVRPGAAWAVIGPGDCSSGLCLDGYTAFCCEIQHGHNTCPNGTYVAGWWKCTSYNGSGLCSAQGVRYYIDCNRIPGTQFPGGCQCALGDCGRRRIDCNHFRYGQCNTQVKGTTEVVSRLMICQSPATVGWDELQRHPDGRRPDVLPQRRLPARPGGAAAGGRRRLRGRAGLGRDGPARRCCSCSSRGFCAATPSCCATRPEAQDAGRKATRPRSSGARAHGRSRSLAGPHRRYGDCGPTGDAVGPRLARTRRHAHAAGLPDHGGVRPARLLGDARRAPAARRRRDGDRGSRLRARARGARVPRSRPMACRCFMSSQAWLDYEVPGAPYFVLAGRAILGEGVAGAWPALASLVRDAIEEEHEAGAALPVTRVRPGAVRARRARTASTRRCLRAGIGPDHPSLFPGGAGDEVLWWPSDAPPPSWGGALGLVALRRVDAGQHHPAR